MHKVWGGGAAAAVAHEGAVSPFPLAKGLLSYSAKRYNSAICWSKMSHDACLSEVLYEQIKCFKSSLQHCGSVRVYMMVNRADSESQMYVLFCYFA